MKNILILITAVVLLNGCTSVTKLEQTPTLSWSSVQEKEGLVVWKKGGEIPVEHAYLSNGNHKGTTIFYVEVKDGYVLSGWSLHPKRGRLNTVINGNGLIDYYDYETGLKTHTRDITGGKLSPKKPVGQDIADFQFLPEKPLDETPETETRMAEATSPKFTGSCEQGLTIEQSMDVPSTPVQNAENDSMIVEAPLSQPAQEANENPLVESELGTQQEAAKPVPLHDVKTTNPEVKPTESTPALFTRPAPEEIAPITETVSLTWPAPMPPFQQGKPIKAPMPDGDPEKLPWIMLLALLIVSVFILFISGAILKCVKQQQQ